MAKPILDIQDLHVEVGGKEILRGLTLHIEGGEIHAVMGQNGMGKSTLVAALMGHPKYYVTSGSITLNGRDVLEMSVDERARAGMYLGMQYPAEVAGVTNADFLRTAVNARRERPIGLLKFRKEMNAAVENLQMRDSLPDRYLNEGFSGGEKKRNEILQMMMLRPSVVMLDEIDSGLDIDALRIVAQNISDLAKERGEEMTTLMITHYQRLLDYVTPDYVHVMANGRIVKTGDSELALRLEKEGYDWLYHELGLEEEDLALSAPGPSDIPAVADDLDALFG